MFSRFKSPLSSGRLRISSEFGQLVLARSTHISGVAIGMASIELRRVSKVFPRGVLALREVDLEARDGELLVLLGPNGSGKTTLLRLIAGLDQPSSGDVCIGDRVVNHIAPHKRNVAMVFQGCVLYPHLTVERNIAFGLDRWYGGWPARLWNRLTNQVGIPESAKAQEIRDRVQHTAQLVGVEHLLGRFPRQLSGGERQRVAIGRAFVRHPAVFLLDEPWSNVDDRLRQPLRHQLRQLCEQHCGTTILVTHDHQEALALGDRIAVLEGGRVHQVGTPAEIVASPQTRFVAEFVSSGATNLKSIQ
jgi:multiple sugar transport system ATP-binding protein